MFTLALFMILIHEDLLFECSIILQYSFDYAETGGCAKISADCQWLNACNVCPGVSWHFCPWLSHDSISFGYIKHDVNCCGSGSRIWKIRYESGSGFRPNFDTDPDLGKRCRPGSRQKRIQLQENLKNWKTNANFPYIVYLYYLNITFL